MSKRDIDIATDDGTAKAGLFTPDHGTGTNPGVVLYMDIFGPRPGLDRMGERLADNGFVVLVPDLFYRFGPYSFDPGTAFDDPDTAARMKGMMKDTPVDVVEKDTKAYLQALADNGANGKVGAVGYCMGGQHALTAAAAYPERVGAAASFHGGGLVTDAGTSPHKRAGEMKGAIYIGTAGEDKSCPPEHSATLAKSLREAGVNYMLENYVGMAHGWAVPDHGVYDEAGAERHWRRLVSFFDEVLK
ncbi:dienelactone hydrolase family protein [Pararhizobium mangrovi]|uniref:Dienelactone hydrolase family protein n=1 Tax=Pararhizobium mangrovi TaxID=2590452 RepID=A0A506UAC5_9HYPH|nr:dienelactone hydrolase family protein [Pararhizobium mangrovi]TPW29905.1 dienelactone hydrolase family protein [Pararhizobium mangrovi]